MSRRHFLTQTLTTIVLLAGCASSYGGRISSDGGEALSPEERRLQQAENKLLELSRRIDSVNFAGMDQENLRLRDDIRALRGEMERLRFDMDQQAKRSREQYLDLDRRLQRFEVPQGAGPVGSAPSSYGTPNFGGPTTVNTTVAPSAPPTTVVTVPPPASGPTTAPAASPGAPPVVTISSGSGATPEEEEAYIKSFDLLKNGKYDDAIRSFRSLLDRWPQGRYADNAWYWMGEANYVKRDYKSALTSFQSLLQRFPTSPKAPDAMLKVGLTQIELKQEAEGRTTLQKVIQSYPQSNAAKLARQRLEQKN